MSMSLLRLLVIMQVQLVLISCGTNINKLPHENELAKRSPIDLKSDHDLRQLPNRILDAPAKNTARKKKAPFIPIQQYHLYPQHVFLYPSHAHSSVQHNSVHTGIQHLNHRIPVLTQTVHHSSSNITHPTSYRPVHELAVLPLRRHQLHARSQHDDVGYVPVPYYGGYGTGLQYGGHGAGHGFHVSYNFR